MLCRRVWHRLGPLLRTTYTPTKSGRHASFGVPRGSTNMTYVLCGGSLTAAVVYAYRTITEDRNRKTAPEVKPAAAERVGAEEAVIVESVSAPAALENAAAAGEQAAALMAEVAVKVVVEETPAEVVTSESAGTVPDLLSSVKILVGPPGEIAAASVGESSIMAAVRQKTSDGTGFESTVDIQGPVLPGSTEEAPAASGVSEEEESAPAPAEEEKAMAEVEKMVEADITSAEELNAADEADHTLGVEEEAAAEDPDPVEEGSTEAVDYHHCPPPPPPPPAVLDESADDSQEETTCSQRV